MICSSVAGAILYLASSRRSLAHEGSLVGYGRYSSTSMAQRAALGMPAASNARCSSARLALLAETLSGALDVLDALDAPVDVPAEDAAVAAATGAEVAAALPLCAAVVVPGD